MNMNKALQNLYHAVSGSTTTKVNISKLLCDIHYAITGKESEVKNNWSRIIDSIATNWPGGGGSSDFDTAEVTVVSVGTALAGAFVKESDGTIYPVLQSAGTMPVALYKGKSTIIDLGALMGISHTITVTGDAEVDKYNTTVLVTGDCTITVS